MTREAGAVRSSQATALSCNEARQWFSALLAGGTGLTEWALVEAHLRQCADCQREQARLQQVRVARRVTPPRALLNSLHKAMAVTRTRVIPSAAPAVRIQALQTPPALKCTSSAIAGLRQAARLGHSSDLTARLRAALTLAFTLTARARTRVIQGLILGVGQALDLTLRLCAVLAACGLATCAIASLIPATGRGMTRYVAWLARVHVSLAIRFRSSTRAATNVIADCRHGITQFAKRLVRFRPLPAISLKTVVRAVSAMLGLALTAFALQGTSRPQQPARATTSPDSRVEPTPVGFVLPPSVAPPIEPDSALPAAPRTERPRQSPSRAAPRSSQRASVREMAREVPALPVSVPERAAPRIDIVGRLSATDRTTAEHDFAALLAGVGGTELGRRRGAAFTAVEVVVPQSSYDDFARGLTRIGSWQLEAARSPLPDTVRATIRVTE